MDEIHEKGPAVSSDTTYMVLGFVYVLSFFISLPFRERQTPMWVQLFPSFLSPVKGFGTVIICDKYLMKLAYMYFLKNNHIKIFIFFLSLLWILFLGGMSFEIKMFSLVT